MYKNKKILIIIPARGGSKRLPGKNIKPINGKPLISYAITAAKKSKYADRIVVSTDDLKISSVARRYGAEVPFIRPAELASDTASTLSVIQHAVNYFEKNEKIKPDIVVLIQPTNPLILMSDIDGTLEKMIKTKTKTCFSGTEISQRPEWMYKINNGLPVLFIKNVDTEKRSQDLPRLAIINGTVYATEYNTLMKKGVIRDDKSLSIYLMPRERSADIDDLFDFEFAEFLLNRKNSNEKKNKNRK